MNTARSLPPQCDMPQTTVNPISFRMPPGAVDAHSHVFGHPDRYPYSSDRILNPAPVYVEDYIAMHDALGVARGVIVQSSAHGTDPGLLIDILDSAPQRFRAIALLDEKTTDADLERMNAAGVRGFRSNLVSGRGIQMEAAWRMAQRVKPFGWHAQFLLDIENFPEFDSLFKDFPIEAVIDHMGRPLVDRGTEAPGFQALIRYLKSGRGWSKLSAPYRTSQQALPHADIVPFAHALVEAAPDRLVWGLDWPHVLLDTAMPNTGDLADLLATWVPDERVRNRILVQNAEKLYGFSPV